MRQCMIGLMRLLGSISQLSASARSCSCTIWLSTASLQLLPRRNSNLPMRTPAPCTDKKLIRMEGITKDLIAEIANKTEGFSGREITKMVVAWHDAAFAMPDAVLTPELMDRILEKFHLQHKLKETWTSDEKLLFEKMIDTSKLQEGSKDGVIEKSEELLRQEGIL